MFESNQTSVFGHNCSGGGAEITNSPVHVHFHIHTETASVGEKIGRALHGLFGERHKTIENVGKFSEDELSGVIIQRLENR